MSSNIWSNIREGNVEAAKVALETGSLGCERTGPERVYSALHRVWRKEEPDSNGSLVIESMVPT